MNDFKDFAIQQSIKGFSGEKISIMRILNTEIVIEDWREEKSKYEGKDFRLDLQIIYQDVQRLVWVSSRNLLDTIKKIPRDRFPFKATIVQENKRFEFR
jgi:hypothetical protein